MTQTDFQFDDRASQTARILKALKGGKKLTPLDALNDFGCFRLGARCYDLRKQGYDIKTEIVKTKSGKHVACYSLEGK